MAKRALVLGGGGVAGIAWETGVIVGLGDAGLDIRNADLFLGTSAGSTVAAQITSGLSLEALFQRQVDSALQAKEITVQLDWARMGASFMDVMRKGGGMTAVLKRIGALALAEDTVTEAERRKVIVSRLPVHHWPEESRLQVVVVDTLSGERRVFDRSSGVDLVDAVAASCAVPLIWPPVTIDGCRYMDGGMYSNENADLASDFERVLVITPETPAIALEMLDSQVEKLRKRGVGVEVVQQDEAMKAAIEAVGGNVLDPSLRGSAAQIGREQGRRVAAQVAAFWG